MEEIQSLSIYNQDMRAAEMEEVPSTLEIKPVRFISHSSLDTFLTCERKFQIERNQAGNVREATIDTAFGHAWGAFLQAYLCGESEEMSRFKAFCAWNVDFFQEDTGKKKSWTYLNLFFQNAKPLLEMLKGEWEVAMFDGKPAVELSFRLHLTHGYQYRAHIDAVLRNRLTGQLLVLELKTTAKKYVHEAMYKNSPQALGYSLVLDKIAQGNSHFMLFYLVLATNLERDPVIAMPFNKSFLDKAKWIERLLWDVEYLAKCEQQNYYPARGMQCMAFNTPCRYFEQCDMPDHTIFSSPQLLAKKVAKEIDMKYDFEFDIMEILNQQLSMVESESSTKEVTVDEI